MNYRKALRTQILLVIVTFIIFSTGLFVYENNQNIGKIIYGISILFLVAGFYISFRYVRCPECNKILKQPLILFKDQYCRDCGHYLTEEDENKYK